MLILFGLSAAPVFGFAQAAPETPESVARAYFTAMQKGDWGKCAGYMDADELGSMKRTFATIINADKSGAAVKEIFGVKSGSEYAQLSETAIFERLMNFITSAIPDVKTALAASTNVILGRVDENAELVHIVYRSRIRLVGTDMNEVELISFKKQGATWRALLTSDMEEMFTNFAESLSDAQSASSKDEEKSAPSGARKPLRKK